MQALTQDFLNQLGQALTQFGTYSFDDKGADEVVDTNEMVESLRKLKVDDAVLVLAELSQSKDYAGRGSSLASSLVESMQDWDELFEFDIIDDLLG